VADEPSKPKRRGLRERALDAQKKREQERLDKLDESIPLWYRSIPSRGRTRWTIVIVFAIVAVAIFKGGHGTPPPPLATNCTTPALALSASSVTKGATVRWSGTGPPHEQVILAVGVKGFTIGATPKQLTAIPDPGLRSSDVQQASSLVPFTTSCRATGEFRTLVPPGNYHVRLFRLNGAGASLSTTVVATRPLTVR
jgi:hypothetical protein